MNSNNPYIENEAVSDKYLKSQFSWMETDVALDFGLIGTATFLGAFGNRVAYCTMHDTGDIYWLCMEDSNGIYNPVWRLGDPDKVLVPII